MSWQKEPCRNFQRGSCRYGDRCKFLHVQQQTKPNPFGFGTGSSSQFLNTDYHQQQQQQPNPFGFGVQSGSQARDVSAFGPRLQTYVKPFENKWVRGKEPTPEQANAQQQPRIVDHKCTDPESCKQLISDDFKHEQPLWKLTCYAHFKGLPCDISGDISYEELRAAAYDEAKQGKSLQMIVERERNLLNAKLQEFTSLLHNPYVISKSSSLPMPSQFPNHNTAPLNSQNSLPVPGFSFGKSRGPTTNTGLNIRPPFSEGNSSAVGQTSLFQMQNQIFQGSPGNSGPVGGLPGSIVSDVNNESQRNLFSAQFNSPSNFMNSSSIGTTNSKSEDKLTDATVWLKEIWEIKEIPDEEPPSQFCK